jgi:hypothetical protein
MGKKPANRRLTPKTDDPERGHVADKLDRELKTRPTLRAPRQKPKARTPRSK